MRVIDLQFNQSLFPPVGECGGFRSNTVGIVTKFVVKR